MKYEARRSQAICNDKFDTTYVRVKLLVFPVFMYGCESWTIKKVEHQRIDSFENSSNSLGLQGDQTSQS